MVLSQVEEEISDESTYHNFVLRLTNVMDEVGRCIVYLC